MQASALKLKGNCWEIGLPIFLIKNMKAGIEEKRKYVQLFNFACFFCFGSKKDSILDPFIGRRVQAVPSGGIFFFLFLFFKYTLRKEEMRPPCLVVSIPQALSIAGPN